MLLAGGITRRAGEAVEPARHSVVRSTEQRFAGSFAWSLLREIVLLLELGRRHVVLLATADRPRQNGCGCRKAALAARRGALDKALVAVRFQGDLRAVVKPPRSKGATCRRRRPASRSWCANQRRIRGVRGGCLLRRCGELLERPHAHLYETGRLRRVHLRGNASVLKRPLVHVCGVNRAC